MAAPPVEAPQPARRRPGPERVEVPAEALPLALARLRAQWRAAGAVPGGGDLVRLRIVTSAPAGWDLEDLVESVLHGAGLTTVEQRRTERALALERTLADTVGPGMRLLVCGLNPSVVAANAGFGFAGATNRFWKALALAGASGAARDPLLLAEHERIGMTDLVKRATPRSSELGPEEYRTGAARVARLVEWLEPAAVVFVGLEGWRAARDRRALSGWQPEPFGGRPAYVMPSTSGLNAATSLDELAVHLARSLEGRP